MINPIMYKTAVIKFSNVEDLRNFCDFCENDGSICVAVEEEKTVLTNVVREEFVSNYPLNADNFFKACKAVSWKFVNMADILAGYLKNEKE